MTKVVLFWKSSCVRATLLYSGKSGCIFSKWLYSGKSGSIPSKLFFSGINGCIRVNDCVRVKVVVCRQKWLFWG